MNLAQREQTIHLLQSNIKKKPETFKKQIIKYERWESL